MVAVVEWRWWRMVTVDGWEVSKVRRRPSRFWPMLAIFCGVHIIPIKLSKLAHYHFYWNSHICTTLFRARINILLSTTAHCLKLIFFYVLFAINIYAATYLVVLSNHWWAHEYIAHPRWMIGTKTIKKKNKIKIKIEND